MLISQAVDEILRGGVFSRVVYKVDIGVFQFAESFLYLGLWVRYVLVHIEVIDGFSYSPDEALLLGDEKFSLVESGLVWHG